ncbi:signal recognition particle subunit SRP19/SEC65 family protein [Methanobrevibacter olleyae]|uniref:Signal recognition particle 19 kDa protein n=1 Tax=Methanobrevibacter olleyae TaxID=294671 RepID=A0A126R0V3_METOL|nr:signal recognition particle subunit SRP19/SEC65 family protein [Methanobrevibacter olleyae]AMK15589.1 signal recognition particle SRP19 protein [Methanobrevibacter olleyae]SFL81132.1 signal recognition particle subunit SRP19 [Methanobrevibacter olleyae]
MKDVMIWPIYLDAEKSLNEGRKISKEYAILEPRIKEIVKATQRLKYKYYAEEDKAYPGEWYNKSGRIIITSDDSKKEILINLSNTIKQMRKNKKNNRHNKKDKKARKRR